MSIFNSLGSNYSTSFAWRALFSGGRTGREELISYLEKRYGGKVVLTYKGREAIYLALEMMSEKGAVTINGYTCLAVYKAIVDAGFQVEYLDIAPDSLDFNLETLKQAVGRNPAIKVVMIQNTLGFPVNGAEIAAFCHEHKLVLIEDLAHSIGATYPSGEEVGTVGDCVILSFSQDKVVDAVSGGALVVRNPVFTERIKQPAVSLSPSTHVRDRWYPLLTTLIRSTHRSGFGKVVHRLANQCNFLPKPVITGEGRTVPRQLPAWYARLILGQYNNVETNLKHRREIAMIYSKNLNPAVLLPLTTNSAVNLRFPIVVKDREKLITFLKGQHIFLSDIWYDAPVAPKKYMHLSDYTGQCPEAEQRSTQMLNLPTHSNISPDQALKLTQLINSWL